MPRRVSVVDFSAIQSGDEPNSMVFSFDIGPQRLLLD
jgi:hypothetical protein